MHAGDLATAANILVATCFLYVFVCVLVCDRLQFYECARDGGVF